MHDRTPDERPSTARDKTGEGTEHHEVRTAGELSGPISSIATSPPSLLTSCGSPTSPTFTGWVYVAFVTDVFNREIVGWQVSRSLHTEFGS